MGPRGPLFSRPTTRLRRVSSPSGRSVVFEWLRDPPSLCHPARASTPLVLESRVSCFVSVLPRASQLLFSLPLPLLRHPSCSWVDFWAFRSLKPRESTHETGVRGGHDAKSRARNFAHSWGLSTDSRCATLWRSRVSTLDSCLGLTPQSLQTLRAERSTFPKALPPDSP